MSSDSMGDVLGGLIVSLLVQGYPPAEAFRLGIFLHGHAADLVTPDKGEIAIAATDFPGAHSLFLPGNPEIRSSVRRRKCLPLSIS